MLNWEGDERFTIGATSFQAFSDQDFEGMLKGTGVGKQAAAKADFLIFKPRWMIERYVEIIARLQPQNLFELGVYQGGSTALLAEVARPRRLVAIDSLPMRDRPLEQHLADRGFGDAVRIYGEVDQADRPRLAAIVAEAFADEPLDLVIDDCSHLYSPTRASFNELFPRLRPGGVYVIEDWPWAHLPLEADGPEGMFLGETPLTRLVFEIVLALPSIPGLIADISIDSNSVVIERGETEISPDEFDVSTSARPRGRDLLA